eukprot:m.85895 g.85895  ORF g.85895 m.85895 type:complete len:465 (-) comp8411_c0_seq1:183-1577(-)
MSEDADMELEAVQATYPELKIKDLCEEAEAGRRLVATIAVKPTARSEALVVRILPGCPDDQRPQMLRGLPSEFHVTHLPPVFMRVTLGEGYPQDEPPHCQIRAHWLSRTKREALRQLLLDQFEPGELVVYNWIQFIADEALDALGITETLDIELSESSADGLATVSSDDGLAAVSSETDAPRQQGDEVEFVARLAQELLRVDKVEQQRAFNKSEFQCVICFDDYLGEEMKKLSACGHLYCRDCITEHCNVQIREGTVNDIRCPNCGVDIQAGDIQSLVSPEIWVRYDRLMLQRLLDQETVSCPRCQQPAYRDEGEKTLGMCPNCTFNFCLLCEKTYHKGSNCAIEDLRSVVEEYLEAEGERRTALETKYGQEVLTQLVSHTLSERYIENSSQQCPSCKSPISKIDGCNKMHCMRCHTFFCWLCLKVLDKSNPYAHFNQEGAACAGRLFQGIQMNDEDEDWDLFA